MATRSARVSGGLNRMWGPLLIHTVDQRVNAACLILAKLENQWCALPYLGPWNNEPTDSQLPMLT